MATTTVHKSLPRHTVLSDVALLRIPMATRNVAQFGILIDLECYLHRELIDNGPWKSCHLTSVITNILHITVQCKAILPALGDMYRVLVKFCLLQMVS